MENHKKEREKIDSHSVGLSDLLGKFVTAKLKGKVDARQGWIVEIEPLIIQGQSGTKYECEGDPAIVINPPKRNRLLY